MSDALDQLLESAKVWRGRQMPSMREQTIATGYPILDQFLPGNGWPRASLTEILTDQPGSGELQLVLPALVSLCADKSSCQSSGGQSDSQNGDQRDSQNGDQLRWISWIAPPYVPYAPALSSAGLNLSRMLIVHAKKGLDVMWAAEQALRCGTCSAVLLWAPKVSNQDLRRLQLAAEEGDSWGIVFRNASALREHSPAAVRLQLATNSSGKTLHLLKSRGGRPLRMAADFLVP